VTLDLCLIKAKDSFSNMDRESDNGLPAVSLTPVEEVQQIIEEKGAPFDSNSEQDEAENFDKVPDRVTRNTEVRPMATNSFGLGSQVSPSFHSRGSRLLHQSSHLSPTTEGRSERH
jgi:hypothetical protein